jgi:hypothetical protein
MTEKERRDLLVANLRVMKSLSEKAYRKYLDKAANEIECLAKENDRLSNHCENLRNDVLRLVKMMKAAEMQRLEDEQKQEPLNV